MQGFLGFALMFAMVCWIWYEHNWFFRHTGLQDAWTVFLNSVLLFVVLFYVYPLKFLTASLLGAWFGLGGSDAPHAGQWQRAADALQRGVVMIFGTFLLLYRHARSLTARSVADGCRRHAVCRPCACDQRPRWAWRRSSIAAIGYLGDWDALAGIAGVIYFLMGPLHAMERPPVRAREGAARWRVTRRSFASGRSCGRSSRAARA